MAKGDWDAIDWMEVAGVVAVSAAIGGIRLLYLIRRGRQFKWFDAILEPCLAVFGGMLMWAALEVTASPDVIQALFTSLGAWGGPRTIHYFEYKYLGGSRVTDNAPLDS